MKLSKEEIAHSIELAQREFISAETGRKTMFTATLGSGFSVKEIADTAGLTEAEVKEILES